MSWETLVCGCSVERIKHDFYIGLGFSILVNIGAQHSILDVSSTDFVN